MTLRRVLAVAAAAAMAFTVAACGDDDSGGGGGSSSSGGDKSGGRVGVVLPDAESSGRWVDFDEPLLKEAFKREGLEVDIQNAQNDKAKFATIAEAMINSGVKVLLLVNLDSPSAAAIQEKAKTAGVKTIDYDRLTLGGSADYYVSFDNTRVGEEQGKSLVKCLGEHEGPGHHLDRRLADRQQRDAVPRRRVQGHPAAGRLRQAASSRATRPRLTGTTQSAGGPSSSC